MSVLGIRCSNKDFTYVVMCDSKDQPRIAYAGGSAVPRNYSKTRLLQWLVQEVEALLDKHDVDKIVIVRGRVDHKEAGETKASWSFDVALQVEKVHAALYEGALASISSGKDLETAKFYVCKTCGNTFENEHPAECAVCNATEFKEI